MDIVGKAKKLERTIARTLDVAVGELVGGAGAATAPLEIVHAVVERAEQEIVETGRGQRVFPFNRIKLHVLAGARDREARARVAAVVDGPPSLADRVRARLRAAGCRQPEVTIDVAFASKPGKQWGSPDYHVEFGRKEAEPAPPPVAPAAPPQLRLTVVHGKAARRSYTFTGGRIDLGRTAQVLDAKQRVVRTNHVAFDEEGAEANRSVSRRHAHVIYLDDTREYRLQDDRSVHGTNIVRNGRTIAVPAGSRGVRLQAGDEILLGQARIRVEV
jgi:hypothetical protein